MGNYTFKQKFPSLYSTVQKSATVGSVMATVPLNVSFWNDFVHRVMNAQLNDPDGVFRWNLH
jgi:hypothetical protein